MLREINHVQLPVPDTALAIDWYTTYLGFTVEYHVQGLNAILRLGRGPSLFLWQTRDATVATFTVNGEAFPTIGVDVCNIAALRDQLAAAGTQIPVFEDAGFGLVMKFFDPFGNMWVVSQPHEVVREAS